MLNKRPIFIVAISRGGSSILLNILRSHPDVCSPRGETNEVFHGQPEESLGTRLNKLLHYLPVLIMQQEDLVSMRKFQPRKPLKNMSKIMIDRIFYREKMKAIGKTQNYFKSEAIRYTLEEIRMSRLLCKNLDALAYLTDIFFEMYPDATFFSLIRNGFAIC